METQQQLGLFFWRRPEDFQDQQHVTGFYIYSDSQESVVQTPVWVNSCPAVTVWQLPGFQWVQVEEMKLQSVWGSWWTDWSVGRSFRPIIGCLWIIGGVPWLCIALLLFFMCSTFGFSFSQTRKCFHSFIFFIMYGHLHMLHEQKKWQLYFNFFY